MNSFWFILKRQWTIKISSPPFFLFLAWWPSWLEVGITGHNFGRGPSKGHSTKVWFKLAQWLQRSWLKCEKLTDGQTLSGDNISGELKMGLIIDKQYRAAIFRDWSYIAHFLSFVDVSRSAKFLCLLYAIIGFSVNISLQTSSWFNVCQCLIMHCFSLLMHGLYLLDKTKGISLFCFY